MGNVEAAAATFDTAAAGFSFYFVYLPDFVYVLIIANLPLLK